MKAVACLVLVCFSISQIGWAQEFNLSAHGEYKPEKQAGRTSNISLELANEQKNLQTSAQFLEDTLSLTSAKADDKSQEETEDERTNPSLQVNGTNQDYERERYEFEEAMDLIRPEFAIAIPIKSLKEKNLIRIRNLDVEVALVAVKGMKFLLTSGHVNEIRADEEINKLLSEASFIAHTHPDATMSEGPSTIDLLTASDRKEYLLTSDEIVSYISEGVQERYLSNRELLDAWDNAAKSESLNEYEARLWANHFTVEMDRLNWDNAVEINNFRASGTVDPTATLTSSNLSSFPGNTWLERKSDSSPNTSLIRSSSSEFTMNYDVTVPGSMSSARVTFDAPNTAAVELSDLSTMTDFIVGLQGPVGGNVRLEIEDSLGAKSDVLLVNLSASMQYYKISKTLFNGIDWAKVKVFTYSIDSTLTTQLTGAINFQNGFNMVALIPPAQEVGLTTYFNFENMTGTAVADQTNAGNQGTLQGGVAISADRPNLNFTANASSLNFDGANDYVSTTKSYSNPNIFSLSLWFKTTTTTGGKLIGFGNMQTGQSNNYDRHIYMTNAGQLCFGVYNGSVQTINSTNSYNDGQWHHVAASLSSAGMQFYVDGSLIGSKATVTTAENHTGYWRLGYDNMNGWTNIPSSFYFKGLMDDARVYNRALSGQEVLDLSRGNLPTPDIVAPVITDTKVVNLSANSALVNWKTDEASDTQIEYGQTISYGSSSALDTSVVTVHSQILTGLQPGAQYHYRLKSKDAVGNLKMTIDMTFAMPNIAPVFQTAQGVVAIDAEHPYEAISRNGKNWGLYSSLPGFSGEGYFWAGPDTGVINNLAGYSQLGPELKYKVKFETAGTYYVWVRGLAIDGSSDSIHVGLDGTEMTTADNITWAASTYNSFAWTKDTMDAMRASITVAAQGEHTVNVWMREDGFRFDKLILTQDANYVPTGLGPQESVRILDSASVIPVPVVNSIPQYVTQQPLTLSGTTAANTSIWVNGAEKVAASSSTSWTCNMNLTEGLNSLQITAKDASGNQSTAVSLSTTLDSVMPTGTLTINNGAQYATSTSVTLSLAVTDTGSGIDKMSFSTDNANWTTAEAFATTKNFTLPTGDGTKTVYVKYFDKAGQVSIGYSKSITLDTTAPAVSNVVATNVTTSGVTINWTTSEASDTQIEYGLTTSYGSSTTLNSSLVTNHSQSISTLQASTLYHYRVKSKDAAGNLQTSADYTFTTQTAQSVGPIGYWNLDSVSNNTISDASGNGNAGALQGEVLLSTDHPNTNQSNTGSLSFDGVDDYVEILNQSSLNFGSGDFSISLWIRPDTISTMKQGILNKTDGTNGYRLITSDTDGDRLKFIRGALFADGVQSNDAVLQAGTWQHVVVVVNANQVVFYVNGINQGGGNLGAASATSAANLFIGQKGYSASTVNFFDGNMDEARIYNRALSAQEVLDLSKTIAAVAKPVVDSIPALTNKKTIPLSGTKAMNTSILVNGVETVAADSSTTWTCNINLSEGLNSLQITAKDATGNQSVAVPISTTLDSIVPVISNPTTSTISSTTATISWTTNEASDTQVEYGLTTSYGSSTTLNSSLVTNHSRDLSTLQASTLYHYRVKSKDAAGNLQTSGDYTFTTLVPPDTTVPVISVVTSANITSGAATITWTTNEASDTQIEYGLTTSYGSSTTLNSSLVTNHSQAISTLQPSTLYHYRVKSKDAAGNLQTSGDYTFTTLIPPDTTVPVISAVTSANITSGAATITWTTNEASDTQIEYGLTTSYGSSTTLNSSLVTNHSQEISTLQPSTLYHYRVKSKDAAGNSQISADYIFTTQSAQSAAPIGYWNFDSVTNNTISDLSGNGNAGALQGGVSLSTDHPNTNQSNTGSLSFDGVNDYVSTTTSFANPNVFSLSLWFKTTTTTGGKLIGLGVWQTGQSPNYDRHIYMTNSGQLYFGVYTGTVQTINTTNSYNDGQWHHVAASLSSAGMQFYVDGSLIGSKATVTTAENYTGYWRLGYDNMNGWINVPSGFYFKGLIDEPRIYNRALSAQEVLDLSKTIAAVAKPVVDSIPALTNQKTIILSGTKAANTSIWVNGAEKIAVNSSTTWSCNVNLTEGLNSLQVAAKDAVGTQGPLVSLLTTLDSIAPTGSVTINNGDFSTDSLDVMLTLSASDSSSGLNGMRFSTDGGNGWSNWELFAQTTVVTLPAGDGTKEVRFEIRDKAGNSSVFSDTITFAAQPVGLADGTAFFYSSGILVSETTPDHHQVFYRPDGSVSSFKYSDGTEIRYLNDFASSIEIISDAGLIVETISQPSADAFDETKAISVSLDGGLHAFYLDGELVEIRTSTGIRVTNFTLNEAKEIQNALMTYPDGTEEVIRKGTLLRRINPDGTVLDFTPKGFAVREKFETVIQYFSYTKMSQTQIAGTKIFTADDSFSKYDELGILREAKDKNGDHFVYDRQNQGDSYKLVLNRQLSSTPGEKGLVEAIYSESGVQEKNTLQNGTQIFFENGKINHILDSQGNAADYSYLEDNTILSGLTINHAGTTFEYDRSGFLKSIATSQGTIERIQEDTTGDGTISDDDAIDLILEMAGGNTLSDFELDSEGNILRGIITTKEGIKQRIENGILTGFETLDGKIYELSDLTSGGREAVLKEWNFKDGTRVVYGGGTISQILFPDGKRLHTIGFDANKQIETVTEELQDGTKKVFQKNKLIKLVTPTGTEIYYDNTGLAEKIVLSDASEEEVSYEKSDTGVVEKVIFTGEHTSRSFRPDGTLLALLTDGVGVEMEGQEISRLFTRFGDIENPQFNEADILSGEVILADEQKLIISNGEIVQAIRPNGTKVNYASGRIASIETGGKLYTITYVLAGSNITDMHISDGTNTNSLVPYLLVHSESELAEILLPRSLKDTLSDRFQIQSGMSTGDSIFVAKLKTDADRETVYELNSDYFPEWVNIDSTYFNRDYGPWWLANTYQSLLNLTPNFIGQSILLGPVCTDYYYCNSPVFELPSLTSTLVDLNGDHLNDRVYMMGEKLSYWLVQFNNGVGFDNPVQWIGVDTAFDTGRAKDGSIRFYDQEHPSVLGTLIDMNGDGLPDRILKKSDGSPNWYLQLNNGAGFDPVKEWGGVVHPLQQTNPNATFALEVRDDKGVPGTSWDERYNARQELIADLVDLDGDGLPDRVLRPSIAPFDHWFFQKNTGSGFADAVLWEGVDSGFDSDEKVGSSLSWYYQYLGQTPRRDPYQFPADPFFGKWHSWGDDSSWEEVLQNEGRVPHIELCYASLIANLSDVIDMNGDLKPDRVLLKSRDPNNPDAPIDWYVQLNNGHGFETAVLWDDNVRALGGVSDKKITSAIKVIDSWEMPRNILVDVKDVTGDGLPDRIIIDHDNKDGQPQDTWWVEVNTGSTFAAAVSWTGIYGGNASETSLGQDNELFRSWEASSRISQTSMVLEISDLRDINGDKIPDRIIYKKGENRWLVQYGTGHGFLPVQQMKINAIETSAGQIKSSRYDYLHVSLKAESDLPAASGKVRVTLGDPAKPEAYQEWDVDTLTATWKDFYLPINHAKQDASEIKVSFIPAGAQNSTPIYVDNVTFVANRPPDAKDWLNDLLTEENVLAEIHSERNQTLAQYLGLRETSETINFDWEKLLTAETRLSFDQNGEAIEFETLYGSVSKVEAGRVVETVLPDGSTVDFGEIDPAHPQSTTQTVTKSDGSVQTMQLSYGRVRTVSRPGKGPLQYSYEFDATGREITVVRDPDTGMTERYLDNQLISRMQANGVVTGFEYSDQGILIRSMISYKGKIYNQFTYETSATGNTLLHTEEGVVEEYSPDGKILSHTTTEGYRYAHTFSRAKKVVTTIRKETINLPDGTAVSFDIPIVTLEDDPAGEEVHRVELIGYRAPTGETISYENGQLKSILLADRTAISFDRFEVLQTFNQETGATQREIKLLDATVFHSDGTITEYRNARPFSVTSATGRVLSLAKENGILINPAESAAFHLTQAEKLWTSLVKSKWDQFQVPGTLPTQLEYSMDGKLVTRQFAEGVIELYEDGRIQEIIAEDGERLVLYEYDGEGNPTQIELGAARRRLDTAVLQLKAEIEVEREKALSYVASREQVLNQTIESQYMIARDRLLAIRAQIEAEKNKVASIKVKGKKAKNMVSDAIQSIQVGINQVNGALEQLARNRADALEQLSQQVRQASADIESQTLSAYTQIESESQKARRSILKQEISPVIYHWYRKILGRDPSQNEYDAIINAANYDAGTFNLNGLKATLLNSNELVGRQLEVQQIKSRVQSLLEQYLSLTDTGKIDFANSLGVQTSELIQVSASEANSVLEWLLSRSLHFGQSAYIALETLLTDSGITFQRVDLASRLVLIDILTGVITPFEQGDLVISLYALRRVAASYGLTTFGFKMTYDALKSMYDEACQGSPDCQFKLIAHINGDHYVLITKVTDTEVTYKDPGTGPENSLDLTTLSKGDFLASWIDPKNPDSGFGYILTSRGPPAHLNQNQIQQLITSEEMAVRGAFFPFLIPVFIAIAKAIAGAVIAAVVAVTNIVSGLITGLSSIFSGLGSFVSGVFTGNFAGAFSILYAGVLGGIGQISGGVFTAFEALHAGLLIGIEGVAASVPYFGPALSSPIASSAFSGMLKLGLTGFSIQGTGVLLDKVGVSPKISQTLISGGKLAIGVGLLATGNPMGLSFAAGGTSDLLNLYTNLPPLITSVVSIGAAGLGAFAGGLIDIHTIGGAMAGFKSALPYLSMDLASAGFVAVGDALGFDPRITSLISMPVRIGLGAGVNSFLHANSFNTMSIFTAIKNGLSVGAKSIGFDFGGEAYHPIFGSLGSANVLQSIESSIGSKGLFSSVFDVLGRALLSPFNAVDSVVRSVLSGIHNFSDLIQQKGIGGAFESLAPFIFSRQTIERLLASGGIGGMISTAAKILATLDGQTVQEQKLTDTTSLFYDLLGNFIGKKENGITQIGTFGVDSLGKWALMAGKVIAAIMGDYVFAGEVENGQLMKMLIRDSEGNVVIEGSGGQVDGVQIEGGKPIIIKAPEQGSGNSSSIFWNMILKIIGYGIDFVIDSGLLEKATADLLSDSTGGNIDPNQPTDIALLNGFWPCLLSWACNTNAMLEYFRDNNPFQNKLSHLGISNDRIKEVSLFGGWFVQDVLDWLFSNRDQIQITEEFRKIYEQYPDHPFVPIANSGGGYPLLKALNDPANDGFGIETAILVGVPTPITEMSASSLDRIIQIYGSEDMFLEENGASLATIPEGFTHTSKIFDTINIELQGIGHEDYFYSNSDIPVSELQQKSSDFIANMTFASLSPITLETFLNNLVLKGIAVLTEGQVLDFQLGYTHRIRNYNIDLQKWSLEKDE